MIISRTNTRIELETQRYLNEKVQPCLSQITLELLKTKPVDSVPTMIHILDEIAKDKSKNG